MGRNMTGDGAKVCSSEGIKPVVHIYRLTPLPLTYFPILLASQVEWPLRPRASYKFRTGMARFPEQCNRAT